MPEWKWDCHLSATPIKPLEDWQSEWEKNWEKYWVMERKRNPVNAYYFGPPSLMPLSKNSNCSMTQMAQNTNAEWFANIMQVYHLVRFFVFATQCNKLLVHRRQQVSRFVYHILTQKKGILQSTRTTITKWFLQLTDNTVHLSSFPSVLHRHIAQCVSIWTVKHLSFFIVLAPFQHHGFEMKQSLWS